MMASGEAPGRAGASVSVMPQVPCGKRRQYRSAEGGNKAAQMTTRAVRPACNIPSCMKGSEARPARRARATPGAARRGLRLHRQQALALHALAGELAGAADRLRLLPGLLFGWLLVMAAKLHLAENSLALHLLLERLEGLVDVVVPDENLHAAYLFR